jgi:hypothetical protein
VPSGPLTQLPFSGAGHKASKNSSANFVGENNADEISAAARRKS